MYPQYLLTQHFLTDTQKMEVSAAAAKARSQYLYRLLDCTSDHLDTDQWRHLKRSVKHVRIVIHCRH